MGYKRKHVFSNWIFMENYERMNDAQIFQTKFLSAFFPWIKASQLRHSGKDDKVLRHVHKSFKLAQVVASDSFAFLNKRFNDVTVLLPDGFDNNNTHPITSKTAGSAPILFDCILAVLKIAPKYVFSPLSNYENCLKFSNWRLNRKRILCFLQWYNMLRRSDFLVNIIDTTLHLMWLCSTQWSGIDGTFLHLRVFRKVVI